MNQSTDYRECGHADCPYRSPAFNATGKKSGYCSMIRTMVTYCCPAAGSSGHL